MRLARSGQAARSGFPPASQSVRAVLGYYGDWPAHQLSELTHREAPWRDARAGLAPGQRGNHEITQAALYEFYDGLTTADQ